MYKAKDAHQTTKGNIVVRDDEGNSWVLKRKWLDTSTTRNKRLTVAIKIFTKGTPTAFEKYDEERHGSLGGGIICFS
jgi:hypothetical protein